MPADTRLSPRQSDTLDRLLVCHSGIPRKELDGRALRALVARELAVERDDVVFATALARNRERELMDADEAERRRPAVKQLSLSVHQQDLLKALSRRADPVDDHELDGRVAKALIARGFARPTARGLGITPRGTEAVEKLTQPREISRNRGRPRRVNPRAEAILSAVATLERAVPTDSELLVGPILAHIDDVLAGFRRFARALRTTNPGSAHRGRK